MENLESQENTLHDVFISLFMMNIQIMNKGIMNISIYLSIYIYIYIYIYIEFSNNQPVYAISKYDDEKLPNQSVIFSSSSNVNQQIEEHHEEEVTDIKNLGIHKDHPKYDRYFDEEE